jgi:hypothetical protein
MFAFRLIFGKFLIFIALACFIIEFGSTLFHFAIHYLNLANLSF